MSSAYMIVTAVAAAANIYAASNGVPVMFLVVVAAALVLRIYLRGPAI